MLISYLLKLLVLPPGINFMVMLGGVLLIRSRRRSGITLIVLGLVSLVVCSMPVTGAYLMAAIERTPALAMADLERADAIVILAAGRNSGAPEYGGDTVDEVTLRRLRYGARLAHRSGLPVLVSGGTVMDDETIPIADLMAVSLAEDFAIAPRWLERRSRNTAENARYSAAILGAEGIQSIALVSDAAHLPRAMQAFGFHGLNVIPAPTSFLTSREAAHLRDWLPAVDGLALSYYALHERLGSVYYRWRYGMPAAAP